MSVSLESQYWECHHKGGSNCYCLQAELEAALHERNIWEEVAGLLYDIANASMTMDFYYDNAKRHLEARVLPTDEVLE